jgi:hypothetical protein
LMPETKSKAEGGREGKGEGGKGGREMEGGGWMGEERKQHSKHISEY